MQFAYKKDKKNKGEIKMSSVKRFIHRDGFSVKAGQRATTRKIVNNSGKSGGTLLTSAEKVRAKRQRQFQVKKQLKPITVVVDDKKGLEQKQHQAGESKSAETSPRKASTPTLPSTPDHPSITVEFTFDNQRRIIGTTATNTTDGSTYPILAQPDARIAVPISREMILNRLKELNYIKRNVRQNIRHLSSEAISTSQL